MTLVKTDQTVEGIGNSRGNCLQAALATVTGKPLVDVIDVTDPAIPDDLWHIAMADWGRENGLSIFSQRESPSEPSLYIAVGPTVRENGLHAVVYKDGALWHDPHSSRAGLKRVRYFIVVQQTETDR